MTKISITLLAVFFITGIGTAQNNKTEPFKGANRIIIINTNDAKTNYKSIIPVLLDNGYTIERKDDEYFTIKTQPRTPNKTAVNVSFNILTKDSSIVISGTFDSLVKFTFGGATVASSYKDIENRGMKGSDMKDAFEAMQKLATSFSGKITYEKK